MGSPFWVKARRARRAAAKAGQRGPLPVHLRRTVQRQQLQANRATAGGSGRGPLPGAGGRPQEEDSRRAQREELQANRAAAGGSARGPLPGEGAGGRPPGVSKAELARSLAELVLSPAEV